MHTDNVVAGRPILFLETCCGSSAVTSALLGGLHAPAASTYQGSKMGDREAVLDVLGLTPGVGADAVLLCDPGPWPDALATFATAEGRASVVSRLDEWGDEDPEDLWRRLRAEAVAGSRDVAAWYVLQRWSYAGKPAEPGKFSLNRDAANRGREPGSRRLIARVEELVEIPWPAVRRFERTSALDIDPAEVGGWLQREGVIEPGPFGADLGWAYVYIDPPYMGTSGYRHRLGRDDVLDLARRWDAAGAVVGISEAVSLDVELGAGWTAVDITDRRRGARRTWSRQQREVVTTNRSRHPTVRRRGRPVPKYDTGVAFAGDLEPVVRVR